MDNIGELIIPALVFIFWAISSVAQAAKKPKQKNQRRQPPPRPYTPLEHPSNDDDARTRRIQEEIRRKIAERRGSSPQPPAMPDEPRPAYNPYEPEKPRPAPVQRPAARAPEQTLRRESAPSTQKQRPAPRTEPTYVDFEQPVNRLEAQLAEQQRRMEETQRKAEEARKIALQRRQAALKQKSRKSSTPRTYTGSLQSSVRATLKDPHAARKAVIYYETLGTPVGLRRNGQLYPHWEV